MEKTEKKKKRFETPHTLVIIACLIIIAAAATWVVPSGEFVRYEDIPVAVYDAVKGTGFLFQRSVIGDLVARTEGHILTRLFSVDADIAVAEKAAEGERTLRIDAVGEIFERRCFAYGELFQLFYPFFRPA